MWGIIIIFLLWAWFGVNYINTYPYHSTQPYHIVLLLLDGLLKGPSGLSPSDGDLIELFGWACCGSLELGLGGIGDCMDRVSERRAGPGIIIYILGSPGLTI